MIRLKRVYEAASEDDGMRVLVERLWPRGIAKERAGIDRWCKEISPSPELRSWYSHDTGKWEEFRLRYRKELESHGEIIGALGQAQKALQRMAACDSAFWSLRATIFPRLRSTHSRGCMFPLQTGTCWCSRKRLSRNPKAE